MIRSARRLLAGLALLVGALASTARGSRAQTTHRDSLTPAPDTSESICYGFSFSPWKPALDWKAAGHGDRPDSSLLFHAPDGRDWAATQSVGSDTTLVLYPAWWPAGVVIALPRTAPAPGDTLSGTAMAYVADGRAASPRAKVRAWRVPCGRRQAKN